MSRIVTNDFLCGTTVNIAQYLWRCSCSTKHATLFQSIAFVGASRGNLPHVKPDLLRQAFWNVSWVTCGIRVAELGRMGHVSYVLRMCEMNSIKPEIFHSQT
jgi:hypothetical protein